MSKKHLTFALLATALAVGFSSCEKDLSDDGLAVRYDIVPGTNIKESQLESKKYTEAEFKELMNGRCYKLIAMYDCYKEWDDAYYVIMGMKDNGEYSVDILENCEGCGREIRLFEGDELTRWVGSMGHESMRLYKYSFDGVRQKLQFMDNKEAVIFVNDDYLITLNGVYWSSSIDAGAMFSRTVYQRTEETNWYSRDTIDLRNFNY